MPINIIIASPPDRKNLVAEIWDNDVMIAEIIQENNDPQVILYTPVGFKVGYAELICCLTLAKEKLTGGK